jgi:hypothetical protein
VPCEKQERKNERYISVFFFFLRPICGAHETETYNNVFVYIPLVYEWKGKEEEKMASIDSVHLRWFIRRPSLTCIEEIPFHGFGNNYSKGRIVFV